MHLSIKSMNKKHCTLILNMSSREYTGKKSKLKRLGQRLIYSDSMLRGVGVASYLESTIVPIPLEAIMIPLMQVHRKKLFLISTVALAGCILGAVTGYAVGFFIFDAIGDQIVALISTQEQFETVKQQMEMNGFWFVVSVGVAPIPFQIAMLAAGALQYSFLYFLIATTLARAIRYYGVALLVLVAGNKAESLFKRHKKSSTLITIVVIGIIWYLSVS